MALLGLYMVACGLLVLAGVAKALRPGDTARALAELAGARPGRRLGADRLAPVVRALAALEALVGVAALVEPRRPVAALVLLSYLAFAGFVCYARIRGGSLATCGCFGSPDTPPTLVHAAVDLALAAGAAGVVVWPGTSLLDLLGGQPFDGVPLLAASAVTGGLAYAVISPLARLGALRRMSPAVRS
jgi:hypothetical protein